MGKVLLAILVGVLIVSFTAGINVNPPRSVAATAPLVANPCPQTGNSGFGASFWSPYDDWTAVQIHSSLSAQKASGSTSVIVTWSVHLDAKDTAYPANPALGYATFNTVIPRIISEAKGLAMPVWLGLVVAPTSQPSHRTDAKWLAAFVSRSERVADDLWSKYGASIKGWYIPTEPAYADISTAQSARTYTTWLRTLTSYLHSHDGNRPVMVSPTMPSAIYTNTSPTAFVAALKPLVDGAGVDVWNLQDGFMMTGWTTASEAQAFALARQYTTAEHSTLWASIYTPARDGNGAPVPASRLTPYLVALRNAGASVLSEWTYNQYLSPTPIGTDRDLRTTNARAYATWCH